MTCRLVSGAGLEAASAEPAKQESAPGRFHCNGGLAAAVLSPQIARVCPFVLDKHNIMMHKLG